MAQWKHSYLEILDKHVLSLGSLPSNMKLAAFVGGGRTPRTVRESEGTYSPKCVCSQMLPHPTCLKNYRNTVLPALSLGGSLQNPGKAGMETLGKIMDGSLFFN